jgi:hypothetical protein
MSGSHSIHLGNAWEFEPGDAGHAAEWVRRFGRPAGLGDTDAVWLVIDVPADAAVTLNGAALPATAAAAAYRVNVTPILRERNLLVLVPRIAVATAAPHPARGPLPAALGRVSLEIVPRGNA